MTGPGDDKEALLFHSGTLDNQAACRARRDGIRRKARANLRRARRISYVVWRFIQNCSEVPKNFAKRTAVSAVIPRFSSTISLTRGAGTRIRLESSHGVRPIGLRNSSRRISPG